MRFLLALAGLASGSTLARVFVVIALLACNSNAASLQPSETRQKWEDLEVITLDSQRQSGKGRLLQPRSVTHITNGDRENRA